VAIGGQSIENNPKILVFSTNNISDLGVDLAGSSHMDYSTTVVVISVPCSSGINPFWVLHALEAGFDGVFIAADGTDCTYVSDCTGFTSKVVTRAQELIKEHGYEPERLKMAAICSVCSQAFVNHVDKFSKLLKDLLSKKTMEKQ